ncbi:MAG: leucine-rich repeat protein [Proteobacteria bacterium]|nr:leucine-rich repeat protein [Pseudomonadota bacterium]
MGNKSFWNSGIFNRIGDMVVKAVDSATNVVDAASKALEEAGHKHQKNKGDHRDSESENASVNRVSEMAGAVVDYLADGSEESKASARDMLASRFLNIVSQTAKAGAEILKNRKRTVEGMYIKDDVLTGFDNSAETLTVPDYVHEVAEKAFMGSRLESIVFEGNIRRIGDRAFGGACFLKSVQFKGDVDAIGNEAFSGCTGLSKVLFEKGLGALGSSVFSFCISLQEIHIPDNCASLGDEVFGCCASLVEMRLPDGCKSIGEKTFAGCSAITKIHLPRYLEVIPAWTFDHCFKLKEIEWPQSQDVNGCRYPVMENLAFMFSLTDDCCERFVLQDGVMKRRLINIYEDDPRGCFNLLKSGVPFGVVPQFIMNATINVAWELQPESKCYEFQMDVLRTCMSLADIITSNMSEDNRAERLYAVSVIRRFQSVSFNLNSTLTKVLLPYVISEVLNVIGGNGQNRRENIKEIVEMASVYNLNSVNNVTSGEDENKEAAKIKQLTQFLESLSINSETPFLLDPYSYRYTIPFIEKARDEHYIEKNYYGLLFGVKSMMEYQFGRNISMEEDLSNESPDVWFMRIGKRVSEKTERVLHLVLFSPGKYMSDDINKMDGYERIKPFVEICQNPEAEYASLLTQAQIDDIRDILSDFELDGMVTDYSAGLLFV